MTLQYVCSQLRIVEEFYLSFLDMLHINKLDSIRLGTFIDIFLYFNLVLSKRKCSYELRMFNFLIESNMFSKYTCKI